MFTLDSFKNLPLFHYVLFIFYANQNSDCIETAINTVETHKDYI